jgi:hypothetical protein
MSTRLRTEVKTLHFGLSYVPDAASKSFTLQTGEAAMALRAHTPATLAEHRLHNRGLAALDDTQLQRVTHFVEAVALPADVSRFLQLTYPLEGAPLPALAGFITYIPSAARARHRRSRIAQLRQRPHALLGHYGCSLEAHNLLEDEALLALWGDADLVMETPLDIARSLTFSHPQLATRNGDIAAIVVDEHIDTANDLRAFATLISRLGPATTQGGWATIRASVDQNGDPLTWSEGFEDEGHPAGSVVYQYDLNDMIAGTDETPPGDTSGLGTVNQALRTSQNDTQLENQAWSVFQGTPDQREGAEQTSARMRARRARVAAAAQADEFSFTLNNLTPGFGLNVPKSSIDFAADRVDPRKGTFGIDAKNSFLRTLSAYVQFLDSEGKPIDNPAGWNDRLPGFISRYFETANTKYISSVTAVNVILGIPMPTDPTRLEFPWPADAASCRLKFGGIGTRNWDGVVDPPGMFLTGIFQYGVPMMFMLGGAAIESTAWFKDFVSKTENVIAAIAVAFPIVGGGVATAAALTNVKRVLFSFAGAIAGILVGQGLKALLAYITAKLTAAQIVNAIPVVGFAFRVAQMAVTFANIATTTVEVLISPATYTNEVRRQLALELSMSPDPLHGTATQPPVWPRVATRFIATVQYRNGTNYTVKGDLPIDPGQRDKPLPISFPELPGGGQFQVVFGVYSDNDWLAGNWSSSWIDAVAPAGSGGILTLAGQIQELLVPLTADTQYLYASKLAFDGTSGRHVWRAGDQPTAVISDLSGGNGGHNLAQLVNITLNDRAYMLGYCWQASGQNLPFCGTGTPTDAQIYTFQNISTLANPQAALKFPSCGFSGQPYLVYDQFGPAPLFSLDGAFQTSLDQGTLTDPLRAVFSANRYALPAGSASTVTVVRPTVQWLISTGLSQPSYDLRREPNGRISVFGYPTPVFSPNNFYVDPRSGLYHLRRVVLDENTPFDMAPGTSYGYFTQPHLDSIVVHPAGYVVGVNFRNSKMEIIQIPEKGVPDLEAEPASMVSGVGIRQGLMAGPVAIAVAADGRLLVLEGINKRVQAFDLNGNPVASFSGDAVTELDAALATDLNQGLVTMPLRDAFAAAGAILSAHWTISDGPNQYDIALDRLGRLNLQQNGADLSSEWRVSDPGGDYRVIVDGDHLSVQATPAFALPLDDRHSLDRGAVTASIVDIFGANGIRLLPQAAVIGNGLQVPASYQTDLARGVISEDLRAAFATRDVTIGPDALLTARVGVRVQAEGSQWILDDTGATQSYRVTRGAGAPKLKSEYLNPVMALHEVPGETATYLDVAVEMQGFIYVLSYTGDGKQVSDYKLDLYDPTGQWLSRTPDTDKHPQATGVNGARLVVDMWRTMYTLNFEHFQGPGGRTEPSISTWNPTTPG